MHGRRTKIARGQKRSCKHFKERYATDEEGVTWLWPSIITLQNQEVSSNTRGSRNGTPFIKYIWDEGGSTKVFARVCWTWSKKQIVSKELIKVSFSYKYQTRWHPSHYSSNQKAPHQHVQIQWTTLTHGGTNFNVPTSAFIGPPRLNIILSLARGVCCNKP